MTLGVYSNSYIPREKYAIKDNSQFNNTDADGHGSFLDEFVQDDSEKKLKSTLSKNESDLSDNSLMDYTIPSRATIHDYIDNFLLINAEQVACTNMTSHLIRSEELKETLGFLNTQAAKTMFQGKKKTEFAPTKRIPQFKNGMLTTKPKNFFSTGIDASTNNFFIN